MHIKSKSPSNRLSKFFVFSLLFILSVSMTQSFVSADLPAPPDRGTIVGPLGPSGSRVYTGSIITVPDPQPDITEPRTKVLGSIDCANEKREVKIKEKSEWGLSVTGPLSSDMTQGIIEATRDLRPPKEVTFLSTLQGVPTEERTWTHTETVFEHIQYKIYVVRQAVPAQNELIGFLDVKKPKDISVKMDTKPCPVAAQPAIDVFIPGPFQDFLDSVAGFFRGIFLEFPNNTGLFSFGIVKVYSGSAIAGATVLRSGESSSMFLPEGSYDVRAQMTIFWVPLEWSIGQTAGPVILTVSLEVIEYVIYIFMILLIIIIVLIVYAVVRRFVRPRHRRVTKGATAPAAGAAATSPATAGV